MQDPQHGHGVGCRIVFRIDVVGIDDIDPDGSPQARTGRADFWLSGKQKKEALEPLIIPIRDVIARVKSQMRVVLGKIGVGIGRYGSLRHLASVAGAAPLIHASERFFKREVFAARYLRARLIKRFFQQLDLFRIVLNRRTFNRAHAAKHNGFRRFFSGREFSARDSGGENGLLVRRQRKRDRHHAIVTGGQGRG